MSTTKLTVLLSILLLASSEGLYAGDLEKRSRIELRMGLRNQGGKTEARTQVGPLGVETTAESDGILVSLPMRTRCGRMSPSMPRLGSWLSRPVHALGFRESPNGRASFVL